MNTATEILGSHINRHIADSSTSFQTFTRRVREAWMKRHPEKHSVEWSQHPDAYEQVEADAQKLARMMPGGPVRMPLDLLPCLLDALPESSRAAAHADLACLLGILIADKPLADSAAVATFGSLLRETGESVQALALVFADGSLSAADSALIPEALRQLREQQGVLASMIEQLESQRAVVVR